MTAIVIVITSVRVSLSVFRIALQTSTSTFTYNQGLSVPNHKNYNFLDCDWFKKLLFSTNSLAKSLSDSLLSDRVCYRTVQ